jgi:hypothetical protein
MRRLVLIPLVVTLAGVVWIYTLGTLFGLLLVFGGIMSLGIVVLPDAVTKIAEMLSAGRFREPPSSGR